MNKQEIIEFLTDNSGEYNKRYDRTYLSKNHPIIYNIIINWYNDIDDNTKISEIYYRLTHNIDTKPACPVCGNNVKYISAHYAKFCSRKCQYSDIGKSITKVITTNNNIKKYGVEHTTQIKSVTDKRTKSRAKHIDQIKQNMKNTLLEKYGYDALTKIPEIRQKIINTNLERYGVTCPLCAENTTTLNKIKETNISKYGVDNPLKNKDIWIKSQKNRAKSSKSKLETYFEIYLSGIYGTDNVISQYKSEEYPYFCDFFIKPLNLYIEVQGHWTHNNHPFDNANTEDINILNIWKNKAETDLYYKNAIYTWTELDVKKRTLAKQNNLNYLEIFCKSDISKCIEIFENYKDHIA